MKDAVRIPVIVNGDILTEDDAAEALRRSGADGVMIGRGCYGRPWFLAQVAHILRTGDPSARTRPGRSRSTILLRHYHAMLSHFGHDAGVRLARKQSSWYSRGLPGSAEFRAAVTRVCRTPPAVRRLIDAFYDPLIDRGANPFGRRRALTPSLAEAA